MLMENLNDFIRIISLRLSIDPSEFYIAGGFARRMYMISNNIPMHENDRKALHTSDVDIFCDVRNVLDEQLRDIESLSVNQYDPKQISASFKEMLESYGHKASIQDNDEEIDLEEIVLNKLINQFNNSVFNVVDTFDHVVTSIENTGMYSYKTVRNVTPSLTAHDSHDYDLSLILMAFNQCTDTSTLFEYLGLTKHSEKEFSVSVDKNKSFGISPKNVSFTLPLCDTIQFIFKYDTVDQIVDNFDMNVAKFKMRYPFDISNIETPIINVDDMYTVNEVDFGDHTPFRLIARLQKYSSYGFTFSSQVKEQLDRHIDKFVDEHNLNELSTYKEGIY